MPEAAATSNSPNEESPRSERNFWVMVGVPVALAVMLVGIVGLAIFFMSQSEEPAEGSNERVVPAGRAQPKGGSKATEATGRRLSPHDSSANDKVVLGRANRYKPEPEKDTKAPERGPRWRIANDSIPIPTVNVTTANTTALTPELGNDTGKMEDSVTGAVLKTSVSVSSVAETTLLSSTFPSTETTKMVDKMDEAVEPDMEEGEGEEEEKEKAVAVAEEPTPPEEPTTTGSVFSEAEASIAASIRLGLHADSRLVFEEAAEFCRQTYEGGSLMVTNTLPEEPFLTEQLKLETEEVAKCDAIFLGFRGNGSKRFLSMDGTKFVGGFEAEHSRMSREKHPMPVEDRNCILVKPLEHEVTNMSCLDTAPCVVCESKTRCQGRYITPWGVCYLPRTSSRAELMSFHEAEQVCESASVRGRVGLFVDQQVPLPVIMELRISAFDRSTFGCHTGEFMARAARLNRDLETADFQPMAYSSPQFANFPGSQHDCVALIPGQELRWQRVPCDAKSCFLCRVPAPHYESKRHELSR